MTHQCMRSSCQYQVKMCFHSSLQTTVDGHRRQAIGISARQNKSVPACDAIALAKLPPAVDKSCGIKALSKTSQPFDSIMVSLQRMGLLRMQRLGLPPMWHLRPAWGRLGDQTWTGRPCLQQQQQLGQSALPAAPRSARSGRAAGRAALGQGRCTAPTPTSRGTAPSGTSQPTARAQWTLRLRSHCCEAQNLDKAGDVSTVTRTVAKSLT